MAGGGDDVSVYVEAGKAAVRLLKRLADMVPLRSDTPAIWAEIARIEKIFNRRDGEDG